MNAAKEKKTFWGRIKSWFTTNWIWTTIKNLFSSNDASRVNTAKQKAQTASQPKDKGVKVVQEHKVTNTPSLEAKNQKSVPQPEKAKKGEPEKDGENPKPPTIEPVDLGANDDKKPKTVAKPEKKTEGVIMSDRSGNPILVVPKCWIEGLEYFTNPETPGEYLVYIQIGNDAYRITGSNKYNTIMHVYTQSDKRFKAPDENTFDINSVLKRGDDGEYKENEVVGSNKGMADMFGLLHTQNVNVTRISGVALHAQAKENESGLTFMIHNGNLILRVSEGWEHSFGNSLKNPKNPNEYLALVKRGKNVYRITGGDQYIKIGREYGFVVNSVLKQDKDGKFNENEVVDPVANMNAVRDILDLNDKTTECNITYKFDVDTTLEVESPVLAATDGQPNPLVTSPKSVAADKSKSKELP